MPYRPYAEPGLSCSKASLTAEQSLLLNGLWTMVTSLNSNDLKEAMQAFMEKRPPAHTGS